MMKTIKEITLALALLLPLTTGQNVLADVTTDPSTLTLPDFTTEYAERAVVLSVMFNSPTNVVVQNVTVANVRAPGATANPPLLKLELVDQNNNIILTQNAWHPLWERNWDDSGNESGDVAASGSGTFYVPLSGNLKSVRISDIPLGAELVSVDVSTAVESYCAAHATSSICIVDHCPFDPDKAVPGICGCGVAETDSDNDGIFDCNDTCPLDAANDKDTDGICEVVDNCKLVANPGQEDSNNNGIGDACDLSQETKPASSSSGGGVFGVFAILLVLPLLLRRRFMS